MRPWQVGGLLEDHIDPTDLADLRSVLYSLLSNHPPDWGFGYLGGVGRWRAKRTGTYWIPGEQLNFN